MTPIQEFYALHTDFANALRRAKQGMRRGFKDEDVKPLRERQPGYAAVVPKLEARVADGSAALEERTAAELGRRLIGEAEDVLGEYNAARASAQ